MLFLLILFTTLVPITARTINVCGTPEEGFWEVQPGKEAAFYKGVLPNQDWPLKGFYAKILPNLMLRAGISDYKVTIHNSYTDTLYETTKTKTCDIGFTPFTFTAQRAFCGTTSLGNIAACTNPAAGESPVSQNACCANFGVPIQPMTIGLMVTGKLPTPNLFSAFFSYQLLNIVALMMLMVILAAHLVWLFERHDNTEQFPIEYLDGIDEAIWWSCTTVTTVGYGDKYPTTNMGRVFGLLWMFTGVAFLGLFAGTIASSVESSSRDKTVQSIYDLSSKDNICTPSIYYKESFLNAYEFDGYVPEPATIKKCVDDLIEGKASGIFYDGPMLKHIFVATPSFTKRGFKVVDGPKNEYLGPAYSQDDIMINGLTAGGLPLKETVDFALIDFMSTEDFEALKKQYFPKNIDTMEMVEGQLDWGSILPVLIFVFIYFFACAVDKYRAGELNSMLPLMCQRTVPEQPIMVVDADGVNSRELVAMEKKEKGLPATETKAETETETETATTVETKHDVGDDSSTTPTCTPTAVEHDVENSSTTIEVQVSEKAD